MNKEKRKIKMNFRFSLFLVVAVLVVFLNGCQIYEGMYGTDNSGNGAIKITENPKITEKLEIKEIINEKLDQETNTETNTEIEEIAENETEEKTVLPVEPVEEEKDKESMKTEIIEEEEMNEKTPKEKPTVVVVEETEFVSLIPQAEDPDNDISLIFTFTSPLDENGKWQTNYGDSGQYTVTITASDGELTATKEVLIIVNKKEELPEITQATPSEIGLVIDETGSMDFTISAIDLNEDPLVYTWKLDGVDVSKEREYLYKTTYDDSGAHTIKVDVSDGLASVSKLWSIEVVNVNRKPVVEDISSISIAETEEVRIEVDAIDDDNDDLNYTIHDDRFLQQGNVFTWKTDYTSSGVYTFIVDVSDNQDVTSKNVSVVVKNMNRPPVIVDIVKKG